MNDFAVFGALLLNVSQHSEQSTVKNRLSNLELQLLLMINEDFRCDTNQSFAPRRPYNQPWFSITSPSTNEKLLDRLGIRQR